MTLKKMAQKIVREIHETPLVGPAGVRSQVQIVEEALTRVRDRQRAYIDLFGVVLFIVLMVSSFVVPILILMLGCKS